MKQNAIIIFTDGSSRGNPGPGGYAAVMLIPDEKRVIEIGGREENTTNNRMELQAVINALITIRKFPGDITINTDSSYVIQGITKWVKGWIDNGWVTSTKEEVLNRDLWELLTSLLYERDEQGSISWKQIDGHSGVAGNERCDEIATAFADNKEPELYDGSIENYSHDLSMTSNNRVKKEIKEKKEKRSEQKKRSKQKAYSYVSLVQGEINIHQTWEECEKRVKGISGAKYKKALTQEEEQEIIKEWQNQ